MKNRPLTLEETQAALDALNMKLGIVRCEKCNDTGIYMYNHNHGKVCEACCKHDKGWWEITEHYTGYIEGADNRCCKAGCGTMFRDTGSTTNS